MTVSSVGTPSSYTGGAGNPITFSHTTTSTTELLLVSITTSAAETVSTVTFDSVSMSLIHGTTPSLVGQDSYSLVYGLVVPAAQKNKTANCVVTFGNAAATTISADNYTGVDTTDLASATNYISDAVNDAPSSSTVLSSGGTSGNLMFGMAGIRTNTITASWGSLTEISELAGGLYVLTTADGPAPDGDTVTWSGSDENAGVLIELVAASVSATVGATSPHMLVNIGRGGM